MEAKCQKWRYQLHRTLVLRLLLALSSVDAISAIQLFQQLPPSAAPAAFISSTDLGISRCSIQGSVNNSMVALHVWLRMLPPPAGTNGSTLFKGFAYLQAQNDMGGVPRGKGSPQMQQAKCITALGQMYLRSPYTRCRFPLERSLRGLPVDATVEYGSLATSHMLDLWGAFNLTEEDLRMQDFELRVERFDWHCNLVFKQSNALGPIATARVSNLNAPLRSDTNRQSDAMGQSDTTSQPGTASQSDTASQPDTASQTVSQLDTARWRESGTGGQAEARRRRRVALAAKTRVLKQLQQEHTRRLLHDLPSREPAGSKLPVVHEDDHGMHASGRVLKQQAEVGMSAWGQVAARMTRWLGSSVVEKPYGSYGPSSRQVQQPASQQDQLPASQQDQLPASQQEQLTGSQQDQLAASPKDQPPASQQDLAGEGTTANDSMSAGSTAFHQSDMPQDGPLRETMGLDGAAAEGGSEADPRAWQGHDSGPDRARAAFGLGLVTQAEQQHHQTTLGSQTQVWVVLAPFSRVSLEKYSTLLSHHVLWHMQLGITRYMIYVTERLGGFVQQPLIKGLVGFGVLTVVHYTEMAKHEDKPFSPTHVDDYLMQVLIYNHALLALWATDSLALVVDIDEYLVTPRPMTGVQVLSMCGASGRTEEVAGLQIQRRDAMCRLHAPLNASCNAQSSYKQLWATTSPLDVEAGRTPHPMQALTMTSDTTNLKPTQDTKAMIDPNHVLGVHVHIHGALPGSVHVPTQPSCARILHLRDLYKWRPKAPQHPISAREREDWWWPARSVGRNTEPQAIAQIA